MINIQTLSDAGVDYASGVKRFLGRSEIYEKVLSKVLGDNTFQRIREDRERGDYESLLADAHEFKGMCGNIALTGPYEAADALVKLLRSDDKTPESVAKAYEILEEKYNKAYTAIRDALEVPR